MNCLSWASPTTLKLCSFRNVLLGSISGSHISSVPLLQKLQPLHINDINISQMCDLINNYNYIIIKFIKLSLSISLNIKVKGISHLSNFKSYF